LFLLKDDKSEREAFMNEATTTKLAADFKVLIDDVEELVKATASQTSERIGDLRQRLEKEIEDGRKALAEKTWFQKAQEVKAGKVSRLGENTWAGLVIATGIGVLLGLLLRRD
jgi:ElaB/YqjD/DUF883 family membrane-anchored ribosome-binding protein